MTNRKPVLIIQTKKQMEKELYNLEIDEYAEQIRNDLRKYNIKYALLYRFIKADIEKNGLTMNIGTVGTMKNMIVRSGNQYGCNVITRLRLISIIRNNQLFKEAIKAIKDDRENRKEERNKRKLELIELLNNEDTEFGREYSKMERIIHHSLNLNHSQQIIYQEKEDGIFRNKRRIYNNVP